MNWYLLQTKPNAHFTACNHLERQGFDVFLPLIAKTIKKNGRFLDTKAPLFPGYLFMGAAVGPVTWKSVNGTRGISAAVTLDGVYRPVNTYIIEGLQRRCDEYNVIQAFDDILPGDRAKIERGPFAEFICTVDTFKMIGEHGSLSTSSNRKQEVKFCLVIWQKYTNLYLSRLSQCLLSRHT